jgi:hypothetical protein
MSNPKPDDRTPVPQIAVAQTRLERHVMMLWVAVAMAALIAVVSLTINVLLVARILMIRNGLVNTLANASRSLDNLAWQGIGFDVPISQTITFEGDVPINQDLVFPFKGNFPVDTTVSVALDLGALGKQTVNVPVKTSVPVDVNVPIHVEQTVHIKTQVPVRATVPIRLGPNDPLFKSLLAEIRAALESIRRTL